ncbi:hypothetical protein B9Z55_027021 [Caenorhabditis nigoni]|uniref:F-box domain-containing protein n=1 Tax=Caenorhabditis nigoni TaxID=1611254 RepID=A0A2G5SIF5_9PELO|nr:hypothetical protein B9Z55_027021 [Caenorhabditis nigoni]
MELSSDFIYENQHFLKSCILYEVLQKKPIFNAYRNFCSTVGQDAMNYPDFEFWFYRFYHGNRDLDYDRSADPEPKTLVDMPVVLMKKISEYLDPVERTFLRSMNHAIKDVCDSFPVDFEIMDITVTNTSIHWQLDDKSFACYKNDSGCKIYKPNSSKIKESEKCYMEMGIEHLAPLPRMPNFQLNQVSLKLFDGTDYRNGLLPVPLSAKTMSIYGHNTNQIVQALLAMNPGHLESICIQITDSRDTENYRMIFETDQFKEAKRVDFHMCIAFNVTDLANFSHLKSFKCCLTSENAVEDVPRIRDIISNFEELESCEMEFFGFFDGSWIREFARALGAEIPFGPLAEGEPLSITQQYQIPDSNECLEFMLKGEDDFSCRVNVVQL